MIMAASIEQAGRKVNLDAADGVSGRDTGRTPEELGRQFEPSAQTIRNWLHQADRDEGRRADGLTTEERDEVRHLRRENKTLREEREILKKAAVWFAREAGSIPAKDSSS
jgi:transposase